MFVGGHRLRRFVADNFGYYLTASPTKSYAHFTQTFAHPLRHCISSRATDYSSFCTCRQQDFHVCQLWEFSVYIMLIGILYSLLCLYGTRQPFAGPIVAKQFCASVPTLPAASS